MNPRCKQAIATSLVAGIVTLQLVTVLRAALAAGSSPRWLIVDAACALAIYGAVYALFWRAAR